MYKNCVKVFKEPSYTSQVLTSLKPNSYSFIRVMEVRKSTTGNAMYAQVMIGLDDGEVGLGWVSLNSTNLRLAN